MPPKKKKAGQSKEELDRIQREEEERTRLEAVLKLEKEAEERQRLENEARDAAEAKERKRAKKEAQLRLLAEKEATIVTLSTELSVMQSSFSSERAELQDELHRMLQLRESLLNEISALRSETDSAQRRLLDERATLADELGQEKAAHKHDLQRLHQCQEALRVSDETGTSRANQLQKECTALQQQKDTTERELVSKVRNLERELEKVTALNKTLQEVIEARESDDRKNVTLMQLLNNQLDENKRRSQEALEEEKVRCAQLRRDLATSDAHVLRLTEQSELLQREAEHGKKQAEADMHDAKAKLEQLKFDMKYLHSELHSYKSQLAKQQQESATIKSDSQAETENCRLSLETQTKKVDELETLLRRKDREHFDKVTFLNAQISNNRTIIAQLQQKMSKEREDRAAEAQLLQSSLTGKAASVTALQDDIDRRKVASTEVELKLNSDISILKTTVFQLQSALVDKEREFDTVTASKDEELRRLRRKLDEHFIPHRNEIRSIAAGSQGEGGGGGGGGGAGERSVESVLNDKVAQLTRELELAQRSGLDTETRLKAQIANQNHIIDSLQVELLKVKDDSNEEIQVFRAEVKRLRVVLEANYIPYSK